MKAGFEQRTSAFLINDPSEVAHGRKLADELLNRKKRRSSGNARILVDHIIARFNVEIVSEVYVACFTALEDDLSQWRAYGSSVTERYAIGFDAQMLQVLGFRLPNGRFAQVLYDRNDQLNRLRRVLDKALAFIRTERLSSAELELIAAETARRLARALPMFKNDAYRREEEWRIILWESPGDPPPSFDASRLVLRPYRMFSLGKPLPIAKTYVMAPTRREIALKAAKLQYLFTDSQ